MQFSGDSSTLVFNSPASDLFAGDPQLQPQMSLQSRPPASAPSAARCSTTSTATATIDSGEPGLPYWTVYLATNDNGKLDPGESYVLTDAAGHYDFTGLAPGTYTVTIVPQTGYNQTAPAATYTVTITTDGTAITGENFGEQLPLPDLTSLRGLVRSHRQRQRRPAAHRHLDRDQPGQRRGRRQLDGRRLPVADAALGAGAVLLATAPHNGGLAAGQAYSGSATAGPAALAGDLLPHRAGRHAQPGVRRRLRRQQGQRHRRLGLHADAERADAAPQHAGPGHLHGPRAGPLLSNLRHARADADVHFEQRGDHRRRSSCTSAAGPSPTPATSTSPHEPRASRTRSLSVPTTAGGIYYVYVRTAYGAASTAALP